MNEVTHGLTRLLAHVDGVGADGSGVLRVGPAEAPRGIVFVERGHICWAIASGMGKRLSGLLREQRQPPLTSEELEAVYADCRKDGSPLGETLVRRGLLTAEQLRVALRRHTAEALLLLAREWEEPVWTPHRRGRYDARFTFTQVDLFAHTCSLFEPEAAALAEEELRWHLEGGGSGLAFVRPPEADQPLPIASMGPTPLSLAAAREIGQWAVGALDLSSAFSPARELVALHRPGAGALVAWRAGPLTCTAVCEDTSTLAYVLARHARRRG